MNVVIVDDHHLVRQGLSQLLRDRSEFRVIGEAATGEEALAKIGALEPDIVLLDLYLPDVDGIDLVRQIHTRYPAVKIVTLSMSDDDEDVLRALTAGSVGYSVKSTDFSSLIASLEWVASGHVGLSRALTTRLVNRLRASPPQHLSRPSEHPPVEPALNRLSPRERTVLLWVARGAPNKKIARELSLAENTVRTHITSILSKLGLVNRVQAAAYAVQIGLTSTDEANQIPASG